MEIMGALIYHPCQRLVNKQKQANKLLISPYIWVIEMKGRTSYGRRKELPVYKKEAATLMGCTGAAKALMSTKMSSVKSAFSSPAPSCFNQEPSIDWQWTDWWGLLHELACAAGTSSSTVCLEQTRWSHCFYDALLCFRQCDSLSKCISLILSIPVCSCQLTSSSSCVCDCVWTASEQLQLRAGSSLSPWVWFWAADSLLLARGRWGGVGGGYRRSHQKALSGGPCLAGMRAGVMSDWHLLWRHQMARQGPMPVEWGDPVPLCASAACVRILAGRWSSASRCYSEARSQEYENSCWARDESKYKHLMLVEGISGSHPNRIWEYGHEAKWDWLWHLDSLPGWGEI